MMMKICVLTNNNHLWLLPGFQYLWNKYCGKPITTYGFDSPDSASHLNDYHLQQLWSTTPNFEFRSLGEQLPAFQWSDGLLMMLDDIEDDYFILMLEDFWLYEVTDKRFFDRSSQWLANRYIESDVLRLDLSGNRAAYKQAIVKAVLVKDDYSDVILKIVETPTDTPYQMSFQVAIWHKENMRTVLRSGESPWQSEIEGSKRVGDLRVLGTKPAVIKYQPVWQHNRWKLDKLKTDDLEYIKRRGWLSAPKG